MAKKKAARKKTDPETGKPIPEGQLGDWGLDVPEEVRELATIYDRANTAKTKATGKFNTAKTNLIVKMKELGIERCPVREGKKFLVPTTTDGIAYETPKKEDVDE